MHIINAEHNREAGKVSWGVYFFQKSLTVLFSHKGGLQQIDDVLGDPVRRVAPRLPACLTALQRAGDGAGLLLLCGAGDVL